MATPTSKEDIDKFFEISINNLRKSVEHCLSKVPLDMLNLSYNMGAVVQQGIFTDDEAELKFEELQRLGLTYEDDCICEPFAKKLEEFFDDKRRKTISRIKKKSTLSKSVIEK